MEILQADQIRSLLNDELDETSPPTTAKPLSLPVKISHTIDDTSPVTAFLQGKNCLTGVNKCKSYFIKKITSLIFVFAFREPDGGNMNFAMDVMFVNITLIKMVKRLFILGFLTNNDTVNGFEKMKQNVQILRVQNHS